MTLSERGRLRIGLSRHAYRLASTAIIFVYLLLWMSAFRHVYGWLADDPLFYSIGMATLRDWKTPFTLSYNINHLYPYVVTYVPLASNISVPSYPLPVFDDNTGRFRVLLLWMVFVHALLLAFWAWFATTLTDNKLVVIVSLLLFASSPTLTLWTPQPESRLVGLPLVLFGVWVLLRQNGADATSMGPSHRRLFLAGSLFGLAQSVQYNTPLYLILPVCLAFAGIRLARSWRYIRCWIGLASLGIGCVWLYCAMELVSYLVVGLPLDRGPTAALLTLRKTTASPWPQSSNLVIWAELFASQMGVPLLAATVLGWVVYLRSALRQHDPRSVDRLVVAAAIPLGLMYFAVSPGFPAFRQTSVLQPFLFLFAGIGIVSTATRLGRRSPAQVSLIGVVLLAVAAIPATQAWSVFQAHQALGRAVEWAYQNKGNRALEWLPIGGTTRART